MNSKEFYCMTRIHQLIALADLINTDERFEGRLKSDYLQCIEDCIKHFERRSDNNDVR